MTTPATPCANCGGPEHPHPMMTGEDTGCMTFVRPPVSLPDALREKLDEYVDAVKRYGVSMGCLPSGDRDAARAAFEAALAPYLADAAQLRELRFLEHYLPDVDDAPLRKAAEEVAEALANRVDRAASHGAPVVLSRDDAVRYEATLREAIDAASRAVPPAPGTETPSDPLFCGAPVPESLGLRSSQRCMKSPGHDGTHAFTTPFGVARWSDEPAPAPPEARR